MFNPPAVNWGQIIITWPFSGSQVELGNLKNPIFAGDLAFPCQAKFGDETKWGLKRTLQKFFKAAAYGPVAHP
jgi:hypothetical protein